MSRDSIHRRMQEVNSLSTNSRALRAEFFIVGIPHNTAVVVFVYGTVRYDTVFIYVRSKAEEMASLI